MPVTYETTILIILNNKATKAIAKKDGILNFIPSIFRYEKSIKRTKFTLHVIRKIKSSKGWV